MIRSLLRLATVGALALTLTGCDGIPAGLVPWINDGVGSDTPTGARVHAVEHVAAGRPGEPVMCAIPSSTTPDYATPYLIPSREVAALGCGMAWARATATQCTVVPIFGETTICNASGADIGSPPILQAMVDRPGLLRSDVVEVAGEPLAWTKDRHDWLRLAECESSGDWHILNPPYSGGTQILQSTWDAFGGREFGDRASDATVAEQIEVSRRILDGQGPRAWPECSRRIGWR